MTTPTFTTPPDAPARTDAPADFVSKANAFVAWLVTFAGEMVTGISWIADRVADMLGYVSAASASATAAAASATAALGTTGYVSLVTDNLALTTGAKSLTTGISGKSYANTQRGTLIRLSDPTARMSGVFSAVSGSTATLTIDSVTGTGSGITDWLLILSALESVPPDTAKAQAIAFATAL
jgi:hypothetical protein